jgi:hypothetical protein
MARRGFLHVLNGDAVRVPLEQSTVPGVLLVYPDILHEGPTPLVTGDEWRRVRSRFLADGDPAREEAILQGYRQTDATLESYGDVDEVVFWFEHDLFDQLLLIRHLHWLSNVADRRGTRFSLICIGEFPGVPGFAGLGQLNAGQLASLLEPRAPLTDQQVALGARAWEAYCATEPVGREEFAGTPSSALPFLAGAFRRHLEDFPSTRNGLSRSERQILEAVGDGKVSPGEAFMRAARMEEAVFMGDSTFWTIATRLASAPHPLIALDVQPRPERLPTGSLRLTDTGRDVLAGRADHVTLNGLDRWMGGAHLTPSRYWRWDGRKLGVAHR